MFELTPWQTWVFIILVVFAVIGCATVIIGCATVIEKICNLITIKRKEYHIK